MDAAPGCDNCKYQAWIAPLSKMECDVRAIMAGICAIIPTKPATICGFPLPR